MSNLRNSQIEIFSRLKLVQNPNNANFPTGATLFASLGLIQPTTFSFDFYLLPHILFKWAGKNGGINNVESISDRKFRRGYDNNKRLKASHHAIFPVRNLRPL